MALTATLKIGPVRPDWRIEPIATITKDLEIEESNSDCWKIINIQTRVQVGSLDRINNNWYLTLKHGTAEPSLEAFSRKMAEYSGEDLKKGETKMARFIEVAECKNAGEMSQKTFIDVDCEPVFTWRKDLDSNGQKKDLALIVNGIEHLESTCVCSLQDIDGSYVVIPMSAAIRLLLTKDYAGTINKYRKPTVLDLLAKAKGK